MKVKVSDVMLDLATGDASQYDAFVQEAVGQVRVSAAYFNAGMDIASLSDSDRSEIVQESAFVDSGLPSDRDGAIELVYESVQRELVGTCRHLYMEAAKIAETADKATTPLGAVNALAKKCGVKTTLNGTKEYAEELAKAVVANKDIDLKNGSKFLSAKAAKKHTKNLAQAMCLISRAYCISCESVCDDPTVKAVAGDLLCGKCDKDEWTLAAMVSNIKAAGKFLNGAEITESDYTTKITKNDLATTIACNFALAKVAKFIKSKFGEDGGKAEALANKAINKCNKKSVSGDAADANEKTAAGKNEIVEINENLCKLTKELIAGFNNSIYSLVEAKSAE